MADLEVDLARTEGIAGKPDADAAMEGLQAALKGPAPTGGSPPAPPRTTIQPVLWRKSNKSASLAFRCKFLGRSCESRIPQMISGL
jgi:hypothetical protein